ncbi:MAG: T9SS type A sorting domain-containing protein [Crocinitomicaceae bacterium]|nr:T9SS type A sorting domain-containing protein [Crocinitomicaceae bacterium]
MKNRTKTILAAVGVFAIAGLLVSFSGNTDDEKMKRYQVIHQENGEVVEYDTVVPMNSSYSVEDFLADKGIENENVEIIQMPSLSEEMNFIHGDLEGAHMIINEIMSDMNIEIHEDGENVFVEMIIDEDHEGVEGQEIKITCTIDDDGNMITTKIVNGEEVEMTQEEIDQLKSHSSEDGHMIIRIEDGIINMEGMMEEVMEELELAMEELEGLDLEELDHQIQIITEEIETVEGDDGEMKIIIRHSENGDEVIEERIIHMEGEEVDWHGDHGAHMRMVHNDGDEDFTIVIVTEDYDGSSRTDADVRIRKEINESNISVYPNPSEGAINIRINQTEELKTLIKITDIQGKTVFKENLGKFSGEYNQEIDLKEHGTGTYMVTIQQGDNVNTEKIIIK